MANEKRLIDANEILQRNEESYKKSQSNPAEHFTSVIMYHAVKEMVSSSPTVDAVEVVHGHWHVDDYDSGEPDGYAAFIEVHCSECGYELGAESGQYGWAYGDPFPLNYCPNCGAKMDGERKDNGNKV